MPQPTAATTGQTNAAAPIHCRTGHRRTDHRRTGHRRTDQFRTGHRRTDQFRTGHRRTDQFRTDQFRTDQFRTGHRRTGQFRTELQHNRRAKRPARLNSAAGTDPVPPPPDELTATAAAEPYSPATGDSIKSATNPPRFRLPKDTTTIPG